MATSRSWERVSSTTSDEVVWGNDAILPRRFAWMHRKMTLWVCLDVLTVLLGVSIALLCVRNTDPMTAVRGLVHSFHIEQHSLGLPTALFAGFTLTLVITSSKFHLYSPMQLNNTLNEQSRSIQACFISGLLLTGTLYLINAEDIPRQIVLLTLGVVTLALSARRLAYRMSCYRRFERGQGIRNVLIVGTGAEGQALRDHIESIRHLGYRFKGFIEFSEQASFRAVSDEVVGNLGTLFSAARKHFVDEIVFAAPAEHGIIRNVLEKARDHRIDLRVVPVLYHGLAWNRPMEYIGEFPTILLHRGHVPEVGLVFKRIFDLLISVTALLLLLPVMIVIAIAVKLDSPGPVFYRSERIGKKGSIFRCTKFRTMVRNAEDRRRELMHLNEREGVLFKITNDPRITRVGRILRKYSLDELPQFLNVLCGDMSVVGPRPPLPSEVREYNLSHLRRLDVNPGITGLWQIEARQDPSFESYISLDVAYVENWSLWLDFKIVVRTISVVLQGTGA